MEAGMQSLLDKLALAGWIEKYAVVDKPDGGESIRPTWTASGIWNLYRTHLGETTSLQVTIDEMPYLNMLANMASFRGAFDPPPDPPIHQRN